FDELPRYWPDYEKSGVFQFNMRDYLILRGPANQLLAVYRIRPVDGTLRRLFNYPLALQHPPEKAGPFYQRKKVKEIT
ncbi:MAG TPA: hypothetical protein VFP71_03105, partial [Candidatus Angelobacter sp.]|nr:hypothetical protein [Candidatus Angelobacter sp.]